MYLNNRLTFVKKLPVEQFAFDFYWEIHCTCVLLLLSSPLYNEHAYLFNPIPAGVLENQDTLGGGQFDPPL